MHHMNFETREFKFKIWDGKELKQNFMSSIAKRQSHENLLQFTGLLDRKGHEIYEGDIIMFRDFSSDRYIISQEYEVCQVKWIKERAAFHPVDLEKNHKNGHFIHYWEQIEDIEIIGNIFQNSENDPKKFFEYVKR